MPTEFERIVTIYPAPGTRSCAQAPRPVPGAQCIAFRSQPARRM